jgi:hypothetical protein
VLDRHRNFEYGLLRTWPRWRTPSRHVIPPMVSSGHRAVLLLFSYSYYYSIFDFCSFIFKLIKFWKVFVSKWWVCHIHQIWRKKMEILRIFWRLFEQLFFFLILTGLSHMWRVMIIIMIYLIISLYFIISLKNEKGKGKYIRFGTRCSISTR